MTTVKDRMPLPLPDDILLTCSNAQFWAKIDMTNSFFQTKMAEEDIPKTAVSTPWGLYEWTVMPMGLCNAPATHQQRVNEALQGLLGTICFVYLNDITIFADTLEEHKACVCQVMEALRCAELYCSPTKTNLATVECSFLGHIINRAGVHADPKKIQRIEDWALPKTVKELRGFLGLVQYLRKFIPGLAEHTAALTPLTRQGLSSIATLWTPNEVRHFKAIKAIVTSLDCLWPPDHSANAAPFWVMTDASNHGTGGVLLQGQEWKMARPIAYWSRQYIPAERNYPTHKQELLAIVEALKEWHSDLLGSHFHILTDHSTLERFQTQCTVLSCQQARWLDTLAKFDYDLWYLPGEDNIVADTMSRYSFTYPLPTLVASVSHVKLSDAVKQHILDAYETDPFCQQAMANIGLVTLDFKSVDALLYLRGRLIIPSLAPLRIWPNMSWDVKHYVQQCDSCQRTKARTTCIAGKLHSPPVPAQPIADIAIDFVGPLPANKGFDRVLTITDRLSGYVRLLPAHEADTAAEVAACFHEGWHRLFGLHQSIVSDRDKLFTSKFWTALHKRLNVKLQLSLVFHPEMDGRSKGNPTGRSALLSVSMLSTCLSMSLPGKHPSSSCLATRPPSPHLPVSTVMTTCRPLRSCLPFDPKPAKTPGTSLPFPRFGRQHSPTRGVGMNPLGLLGILYFSTRLMDRFDGPYCTVKAQPEISSYTLQLDGDDAAVPFLYTGKLKTYCKNDTALFPNQYIIEDIVDERIRAGKQQYLVPWVSWPSDSDSWEPAEALEDTEALDGWERRNKEAARSRFKIPIDIFDDSMCNVPKQGQLAELWDKAPMQHRRCFQLVRVPKQCLPIIPKSLPAQIVDACIMNDDFCGDLSVSNQQCNFWLLATADRMTETEQAKAQRFADFFGVEDGLVNRTEDSIALPRELLPATTRNSSGLIRHVYPVPALELDNMSIGEKVEYFREQAKLAPKNSQVDHINNMVLNLRLGDAQTFYSAVPVENEDEPHCSRSSIFRVSTSPGWRCSTLDAGLDDGLSPSAGSQ
ncbi:BQ5605_C011g06436 [Microbotryum silenes-dioicae]|uniref:BQ5605_C011g06436 protein n=1 Tax=Microbotryum silenes-dioicae TaxID=796604 RepID=A0A2X0LP21_9BASI|nr:BQ5605_C011g06436 [Microbotryum silenes-dioicae]